MSGTQLRVVMLMNLLMQIEAKAKLCRRPPGESRLFLELQNPESIRPEDHESNDHRYTITKSSN